MYFLANSRETMSPVVQALSLEDNKGRDKKSSNHIFSNSSIFMTYSVNAIEMQNRKTQYCEIEESLVSDVAMDCFQVLPTPLVDP